MSFVLTPTQNLILNPGLGKSANAGIFFVNDLPLLQNDYALHPGPFVTHHLFQGQVAQGAIDLECIDRGVNVDLQICHIVFSKHLRYAQDFTKIQIGIAADVITDNKTLGIVGFNE